MSNLIRQKISIWVGIVFVLSMGCYNDAVIFPEGEQFTGEASFSDNVIPIFNADCNTSGCHSAGGVKPDLTPVNAYSALSNGGYLNTDVPEESVLYIWMNGGGSIPMPPSGTDATSASTVLAWIQQGALDN
jgi:hypothetical protein